MRRKDREVTDGQKFGKLFYHAVAADLDFMTTAKYTLSRWILDIMRIMGGAYFTFTVRKKVENTA